LAAVSRNFFCAPTHSTCQLIVRLPIQIGDTEQRGQAATKVLICATKQKRDDPNRPFGSFPNYALVAQLG